jgi:hypothetical protein
VALQDGFHIHIGLAPITEDPTDWVQVLKLMEPQVPADSWVILEHVATAEEAHTSLAYLREAAAKANVTLD